MRDAQRQLAAVEQAAERARLLLAVERRLDRPAQRDATVDAHLRIAVDDHFDPVPRRNAYVDHKEVGTVHLRLGDFAYPYSVNHNRFGFI